ncbi:MAG: PEGA domain-containing protein [Kofleriaceae bacterium]|nr:PEGA domain-containing protein [Kofleriaceae bacterium]
MQQPGQQPLGRGGFPQVPGLATSAQLAMEIDELPDAYRLSGGPSRAKWLVPVIGFLLLATAAAAAAYFLLTDKSKAGGETTAVTIVSIPEGASVTVNEKLLAGKTPTTFENAVIGEPYKILITYKGYKSWEKTHTVGGRRETVTARMDQILVTLTLTSSPSGANVYLNGSKSAAGTTPLVLEDKVPGNVTNVEIKLDGFQSATRRLDWAETDSKTENFNLKR